MTPRGFFSIVIPGKNEADNLGSVLEELEQVLSGETFEVVIVDDGSTDNTPAVVREQKTKRSFPVRGFRHHLSTGKSLALRTGMLAAQGEMIVTMDGDGQNDPVYIIPLLDAVISGGPQTGIAAGQRLKRGDSDMKKYASQFANTLRRSMLGDGTRDTACGLKAVRTDVFRRLPFFEGSHRFLPALVLTEGFGVAHVDVIDRQRLHGASKYGIIDRGMQGALDLFGVWWLRRRRKVVPQVSEITGE